MASFRNLVTALALSSTSAFLLPSTTSRLSPVTPLASSIRPDNYADPNHRRESVRSKYKPTPNTERSTYMPTPKVRRSSPPPQTTTMEGNYRPGNKFDQDDPFIRTPYGQVNDMNRPEQHVRYARANVNDWKREQNRQDEFISGAYGSGGPGRYGLDIGGPSSERGRGRDTRYVDPKARQQEDFINNPYGNKRAPIGQERRDGRGYERYQKTSSMEPDDFDSGAPKYERYKPREERRRHDDGPGHFERYRPRKEPRMDHDGPRLERYRPEPRREMVEEDFRNNPAGSNRMEAPTGGPGRRRLERYDPRDERMFHDRRQSDFVDSVAGSNRMHREGSTRYERFDPRQDPRKRYGKENELIERSPGKSMRFDPRRYESRRVRTPEERERDEEEAYHRAMMEREESFIDNPNGSSFRPSQYGHGNDGGGDRPRHADYDRGW